MKRFFAGVVLSIVLLGVVSQANAMSLEDAIATQESGNKPKKPYKDTNGQIVMGYFSISHAFWKDATDFDKTLGGRWEDCETSKGYGWKIILAYNRRYHPKDMSDEAIARTVQGGWNAVNKKTAVNTAYWNKIQGLMRKQ